MTNKIYFIIGLTTGIILSLLFLRFPLLLNLQAQGSYALGQQYAKNFSRGGIQLSSRILFAGLEDGRLGWNRLNDTESQKGKNYLIEQAKRNQVQQSNNIQQEPHQTLPQSESK